MHAKLIYVKVIIQALLFREFNEPEGYVKARCDAKGLAQPVW